MEQVALSQGGERAQVQSVLLLTDGHANHGITSKAMIVQEMKNMQDKGLGAVGRTPVEVPSMVSCNPALSYGVLQLLCEKRLCMPKHIITVGSPMKDPPEKGTTIIYISLQTTLSICQTHGLTSVKRENLPTN